MLNSPRIFEDIDALVGTEVGQTERLTISQEMVNKFAEITGDSQWIHVDPDRARTSVYGGTIAHGFLILSLCGAAVRETLRMQAGRGVNYGLDRVRFIEPLKVGDSVRAAVVLDAVEHATSFSHLTLTLTFESSGYQRPVCVAQMQVRYYREM